MTKEISALCKKLLEDKTVEAVIAFQPGGAEGMSLPYIFSDPAEAEGLVWNNRCVPALGRYLIGRKGKTAIVAKPCDGRAVVSLCVEKQVKREDVHIIGVACAGMEDEKGEMLLACKQCKMVTPPVYDDLIEDPAANSKVPQEKDRSHAGDLKHFEAEIEKCILCFACRQACYGCYCSVCFMERGVPNWQPANPDKGAKMLYHATRAMHLAGRCVECGACDNACASGVNLRYIISGLTDFVEELYEYKAGIDLETPPAMQSYTTADREVGFLGGDTDV
jgi:coenzyme F420-reducing hydrogenase beta subunit